MNYRECFEKVREIIANYFNIDAKKVQLTSKFVEDFKADSLDAVELKAIFEENFQIKIPNEVVAEVKTVKNFINYLVSENVLDHKILITLLDLEELPYLNSKWEKHLYDFMIWSSGDKSEPPPECPFSVMWEMPLRGGGGGRGCGRKISKSKKKKLAAKQAKKQAKQNSSEQKHRKKPSKANRKQKFLAEQNKNK